MYNSTNAKLRELFIFIAIGRGLQNYTNIILLSKWQELSTFRRTFFKIDFGIVYMYVCVYVMCIY
jgi:hypothetical protein